MQQQQRGFATSFSRGDRGGGGGSGGGKWGGLPFPPALAGALVFSAVMVIVFYVYNLRNNPLKNHPTIPGAVAMIEHSPAGRTLKKVSVGTTVTGSVNLEKGTASVTFPIETEGRGSGAVTVTSVRVDRPNGVDHPYVRARDAPAQTQRQPSASPAPAPSVPTASASAAASTAGSAAAAPPVVETARIVGDALELPSGNCWSHSYIGNNGVWYITDVTVVLPQYMEKHVITVPVPSSVIGYLPPRQKIPLASLKVRIAP